MAGKSEISPGALKGRLISDGVMVKNTENEPGLDREASVQEVYNSSAGETAAISSSLFSFHSTIKLFRPSPVMMLMYFC